MILVSKGKHKVCSGDLSRLVFVPLIEKIVKFLFLDSRFRCKLIDVPHLDVSNRLLFNDNVQWTRRLLDVLNKTVRYNGHERIPDHLWYVFCQTAALPIELEETWTHLWRSFLSNSRQTLSIYFHGVHPALYPPQIHLLPQREEGRLTQMICSAISRYH